MAVTHYIFLMWLTVVATSYSNQMTKRSGQHLDVTAKTAFGSTRRISKLKVDTINAIINRMKGEKNR